VHEEMFHRLSPNVPEPSRLQGVSFQSDHKGMWGCPHVSGPWRPHLLRGEPLPRRVLTAGIGVGVRQLPLHHKDAVALLPQCCQEGCEVQVPQKLCRAQRP